MVKTKEDLTGKIFGKLTVLHQVEDYIDSKGRHESQWLCECSCENHTQKIIRGDSLRRKNGTKSCGCLIRDFLNEKNKKEDRNKYDLSGEYGIGWTSNTNREFYFDLEDYDKIKDFRWREAIDRHGYHYLTSKSIRMNYLIVGKYHDHKNRNPFDNRKENLRPYSCGQNQKNRSKGKNNTSGIIGITWKKRNQKWQAQINVDKKKIYLGIFADKEDAIRARLNAEKEYFGEFAPQKNLFEQYGIW